MLPLIRPHPLSQREALKKLERIWNQKLAESGFKDIETVKNNERILKEWDSSFFQRNYHHSVQYEATCAYYDLALDILNTHEFENESHRLIWKLHCEGMPEREIALQVGVYKKSMVHYVIKKIARMAQNK